jgi:hypothetical protein
VASKYSFRMKELVQHAKGSRCVKYYWGKHAHLTKVTKLSSTIHEMKRQVDLAQSHTNYQVSMMAEDLVGVISLGKMAKVIHPVTKATVGKLSIRCCLLNYLKMRGGDPMIVEVHQEDIAKPTTIIILNTLEAERMVLMMNANLPAFLWYMFI